MSSRNRAQRAQQRESAPEQPAEPEVEDQAPQASQEDSKPSKPAGGYVVAEGRSIFCARTGGAGLQAGEKVQPGDFQESELAHLEKLGAIVRA